ncbi:hypothetical protein D3C87_1220370 [compost metagenome]
MINAGHDTNLVASYPIGAIIQTLGYNSSNNYAPATGGSWSNSTAYFKNRKLVVYDVEGVHYQLKASGNYIHLTTASNGDRTTGWKNGIQYSLN